MDIFHDLDGMEHSVESCNGVEEKIDIETDNVAGFVATLDGEPKCDISSKVYQVLKKIYK